MNRQELYHSLLSAVPIPLLVVAENRKIVFCNKSYDFIRDKLEKKVELDGGQVTTLENQLGVWIEHVQRDGHREAEVHIEDPSGHGSVLRIMVSKLSFVDEAAASDKDNPCPPESRQIADAFGRERKDLPTSYESSPPSSRSYHAERVNKSSIVPTELGCGPLMDRQVVSQWESISAGDCLEAVGEQPCILVTLNDISDQIRLEEQLIQSEKLVAMTQLATSIAHEFGNPINAIMAILQEIKSGFRKKGFDVKGKIATVLSNLKAMDQLLKDLMNFTTPRATERRKANIRRLISQVLMLVSSQAARQHIKVHVHCVENIPECFVDTRQMKQVFLNLFKNAIEAMHAGGELTVRIRHPAREDEVVILQSGKVMDRKSLGADYIVVEITDTGLGIAEEEMSLLFKPFYTTKAGGTGLGLPVCRTIIEDHLGSIKVESTPGKGSRFTLLLPSFHPFPIISARLAFA
ncbi:MAG: ATP-binding protein, partial [Ignavibacteriales bacterium]|nr:ATP-binding protein [Ignavibacteriales bacterium]